MTAVLNNSSIFLSRKRLETEGKSLPQEPAKNPLSGGGEKREGREQ